MKGDTNSKFKGRWWLYVSLAFFIVVFLLNTLFMAEYFIYKSECEKRALEQLHLEEKTIEMFENLDTR